MFHGQGEEQEETEYRCVLRQLGTFWWRFSEHLVTFRRLLVSFFASTSEAKATSPLPLAVIH
jgi:hypothetical protein